MNLILRITAVLVSAVGTAGILIHDVHVDRMALVAFSAAGAIATYSVADNLLQKSDHTHVHGATFDKQPGGKSVAQKNRVRDDNRRYIQNKKVLFTGGGEQNSLWPSV